MSLDIYFYATSDLDKYPPIQSKNITHNLANMAEAAGIYMALWRPEEAFIEQAKDLAKVLEPAIEDMIAKPDNYKPFSAANGWGTYEQFIPWLKELLAICNEYPDSYINASR